jgi:predicted hotdog family 3-hydroxylacyl-ACP dehydratase
VVVVEPEADLVAWFDAELVAQLFGEGCSQRAARVPASRAGIALAVRAAGGVRSRPWLR